MKHLANGLTLSRIVLSIMLIFVLNRPAAFIVIYAVAGLTDVLDGRIARRTNTVSDRGAKLDSIADLLMFGAATAALVRWAGEGMGMIWPYLAGAVAIRLATAVYAACKYRTVAMIHTWGNKMTGLLVFSRPLVPGRGGQSALGSYRIMYPLRDERFGRAADSSDLAGTRLESEKLVRAAKNGDVEARVTDTGFTSASPGLPPAKSACSPSSNCAPWRTRPASAG
ncbi:CDP-alcohol phosphatidyltransferase family protein [Paenibacillus macerans]|uniref:CDP-alcohol phosphatidyltransferase family protein n=1 Tax=Paenibacillus macerans TaxID=44252 RepID=UPI003D32244C